MSNLAYYSDDFPDAAGKNLDDASALSTATRHDGCGYLTGYVVECSLKSLIIVSEIAKKAPLGPKVSLAQFLAKPNANFKSGLLSGGKKARDFGHDLNALSTEAQQLAALPNAATAPYTPSLSKMAIIGAWRESIRYRRPGFINATTATQWLSDAKNIYQATIGKMRRDGVIF